MNKDGIRRIATQILERKTPQSHRDATTYLTGYMGVYDPGKALINEQVEAYFRKNTA